MQYYDIVVDVCGCQMHYYAYRIIRLHIFLYDNKIMTICLLIYSIIGCPDVVPCMYYPVA